MEQREAEFAFWRFLEAAGVPIAHAWAALSTAAAVENTWYSLETRS